MKKFKFTLQTVHSVRELKQEKELLVLSELQAEAAKAAARVSEIEKMRFHAIERYSRRMEAGERIDPFELELNSNHISALDRLKQEAIREMEEKKQDCVRQSGMVAAATQQVKITSQLRENQKQRHHLESARQEQNALDELVSANFARRMSQTQ